MALSGMRGLSVFIIDVRNCQNKEQERLRVDKELGNIRTKFKNEKTVYLSFRCLMDQLHTSNSQVLFCERRSRYWSTLARDMPFAGLMVMFYESMKEMTEYGSKRWAPNSDFHLNSSLEGFLLGGVAGGLSAYITTPLDVIKTRLQVQGPTLRYNGWLDAIHRTWMIEGTKGFLKGSVPRIL